MRISFQTREAGQNSEISKIQEQQKSSLQKIGTNKGYAVEFSRGRQSAFGGRGKTIDEVMEEAGTQNVALTHNYMAVMSNSMSEKDFAKLQEDGFHPGSIDIKEAVTIVDKIKASLLEAGVSIAGYTNTLDTETLTEITGSQAMAQQMQDAFSKAGVSLDEDLAREAAQAYETAAELTPPGDDTISYMVENKKDVTIDELYLAKYSSAEGTDGQRSDYYRQENGYLAKAGDETDLEALTPQIEKILDAAGYAENKEALDGAKWLIDRQIPLTRESLSIYMQIKGLKFPLKKDSVMEQIANAAAEGKSPKQADLTKEGSSWERAAKLWKQVQKISDQAADLTVSQGKTLHLSNLQKAQREMENGYKGRIEGNLKARRQLEEVRLQMTIAANRELLKSGYAIETAELEELVEALKEAENLQNQTLFATKDPDEARARADLYEETVSTAASLPEMPLSVVGHFERNSRDFRLDQVKIEKEQAEAAYQKANERYETFMTAPRRDMGDSIQKAFRNAEELLEELSLEATDPNKRAVRILGYNRMEITEENIQRVKEADQSLLNVVRKLTPAAALQLIRDGKNPLTMSVAELDDYLSGQEQDAAAEQEKYSRYLYKLEQRKEITEEEKDSYIGIYRLIRQIEKSDGAVIGSLLNQGAELTFKNLLGAVRSSKARGTDIRVDDSVGMIQEVQEKGIGIDRQIEGYFKSLHHEIYDTLSPDALAQITENGRKDISGMDLEQFADRLRELRREEELDTAYEREQISRFRNLPKETEEAAHMLSALEEAESIENLLAANDYQQNLSKTFMKIRKGADIYTDDRKESFAKALSRMEDSFEDRDLAIEGYRELTRTEKEILEDGVYERNSVSSLDVREMGLMYKQISFMTKMSEKEQYEIPILTGDSVMALHLQVVHSKDEKGKIEASMETESYGKLSIQLQVQDGKVSGFFIGSEKASEGRIESLQEHLKAALSKMGLETESMNTGFRKDLKTGFSFSEDAAAEAADKVQSEAVSTRDLYRTAKALIVTVREQLERG